MNKRIAAGVAAGALLIGGAGTALMIPALVAAADPTASTAPSSTTPSATSQPGTTTPDTTTPGQSGTPGDCAGGMHGGPGGMGADDVTSAAKALGMTEADLTTALQGGQTIADVASSKGVDVQTVIDAMVKAEKAEIQAQVDAGTITQAQADQRIADLTAHETAEVNGTFTPGMGGGPGRHGQPPSNSSNGSGNGSSDGSSTTPSATSTSTSS